MTFHAQIPTEWDADRFAEFQRELDTQLSMLVTRGESTVTPTAASGTITSATASLKWTRSRDRVAYSVTATITTNGTGAGHVKVTMPFLCAETTAANGTLGADGSALSGIIGGGGTEMRIFAYDGTYPGADGAVLLMAGSYRASRL